MSSLRHDSMANAPYGVKWCTNILIMPFNKDFMYPYNFLAYFILFLDLYWTNRTNRLHCQFSIAVTFALWNVPFILCRINCILNWQWQFIQSGVWPMIASFTYRITWLLEMATAFYIHRLHRVAMCKFKAGRIPLPIQTIPIQANDIFYLLFYYLSYYRVLFRCVGF